MNKILPLISALIFSCIFGFSFLFTKGGLDLITPFHLLAYRFTLAALSLTFLWVVKFIKLNYSGKKIKLLFLLTLFQPVLYFSFETLGLNQTTTSEAGLIISLIPIIVTFLASIFLREKPNSIQVFFILLSVTGVIFIVLMKGISSIENNYPGMIYLFGAVLMGGIYNILSRKLSLEFKPMEITFMMMWSGAVFFNLLAIIKFKGNYQLFIKPLFNSEVFITILYLGILSSVIAYLLLNYTLSRIEAAQAAVFANLTTVISILAGVIFRNEPFYWFQILGGLLIIVGVWGTNYFGHLKRKPEQLPS